MAIPASLKFADAGTQARTAIYTKTLTVGQVFSAYRNTEYAPFIGLDMAITNLSAGPAVISLDGKEIDVPVAGANITTTYFDQIKVISAGSDGGLRFAMEGVLLSDVIGGDM